MTDNQRLETKEPVKFIFVIVLLFSLNFSIGQNLVRNHSFESVGNLPILPTPNNGFEFEPSSGYRPFQKNLKYWTAGSKATPDLRIISKVSYDQCKEKYKDCNRPRSGDHIAGIMTYLKNSNTKTYREYIQIKLKSPLKPGIKTYCEIWVQKDRQAKLVSNNIGFHFSRNPFFQENEDNVEKIPQVNHDSILNLENLEWQKIEKTFIPKRKYIYVTIGNFFNNEQTKIQEFKKYRGQSWEPTYAHYLIDDVRIWQEGDQPEPPTFDIKKIEKNQPIVLKNIFFDFDQSTLKNESFEELNRLFTFLQKNKNVKIAIHGHTDNRGNDNYNLKLSSSRAHSVMDFLIKKGIEPSRLIFDGFGETQPIDSNENEKGRSKNRRVEFLILEK